MDDAYILLFYFCLIMTTIGGMCVCVFLYQAIKAWFNAEKDKIKYTDRRWPD